MKKAGALIISFLFIAHSFAQAAMEEDIALAKMPPALLNDIGYSLVVRAERTRKSGNNYFLAQGLSLRAKREQKIFFPVPENDANNRIRLDMDFSSMNIPEAAVSVSYSLKRTRLGFSAEPLYIIDWKEALLNESTGVVNKYFSAEQVQYTPLPPRFIKLSITFNF